MARATYKCPDCDKEFKRENPNDIWPCPECGFTSENCSHPKENREMRIEVISKGKDVRINYCSRCYSDLD